jgi:hypothetical protein
MEDISGYPLAKNRIKNLQLVHSVMDGKIKEIPSKICPNCQKSHKGKHLCCSGDCYKAWIKSHK